MGFSTMSGIPKVTSTSNWYSNTNPLLQGRGIGGFAEPSALFGNSEQGAWWDFSDLDNMYVDSVGSAKAALEGPVGFVVDKRINQGNRGTEIVPSWADGISRLTNNSSGTAVVIKGSLVLTNQIAAETVVSVPGFLTQANKAYEVIVTGTSGSGGGGTSYVVVGNVNVSFQGTNVTVRRIVTPTNAGLLTFNQGTSNAGDSASYASVSVKLLDGNHLVQPTAGARPTLSRRYNLLVKSDAVDSNDAGWSKGPNLARIGQERALNGKVATIYQGDGSGGNEYLFQTVTVVAGSSYTLTCNARLVSGAKPTSGNLLAAELAPAGAKAALSFATSNLSSVEQTFSLVFTPTGSGVVQILQLTDQNTTASIALNSIDLRLTADVALAIPAYQRVDTASVYDTLGFPAYLLFDGATKWMQSAGTVDFSTTDKITAIAGLTKLSDAAQATVCELGTGVAANGSFGMFAPVGASPTLSFFANSGGLAGVSDGTKAAPTTNVVTGTSDNAGNLITEQTNNGVINTAAGLAAGNYQNATVYIGARTGSSIWYNGRLFGVILRNAATNANDLSMTNKWMGSKCGKFF